MKKMFFYANFRTYDNTVGITQKVKGQIEAFERLGYDVTYTGYLIDGVAIFNNGKVIKKINYPFKHENFNHLIRRNLLLYISRKFISENKIPFEFAYLRYHFFDPAYIDLMKAIKFEKIKTVIEMHSYPVFTQKDVFNPFKYFDSFCSRKVKKYCDLIVAMTNLKNILGVTTLEIENSITPLDFKVKYTPKIDENFTLINVAFENITHGLDRVINGISQYYQKGGEKNVELLLIGQYSEKTKNLVSKLSLQDKIIFLGKKEKDEMSDYFDRAHMAIGSLGNHRANSYYGSALKTKEYIARGIPFVYGWKERVLNQFPYAMKVPLCEEAVDITEMIGFYDNIYSVDLSSKMHKHLSLNNVTWTNQFNKIINFINGDLK
jgi:glycosyltransferase involved in cell wall biosynthesis